MRKSKKFLAVVLALIMALSVAVVGTSSFAVFAAEDNGEKLEYSWGTEVTTKATMYVGDTKYFYCSPTYNNLTFHQVTNSDSSVVSASSDGYDGAYVVAKKPGTATVTITVMSDYSGPNWSYDYKKDILHVDITVKAKGAKPALTAAPTNVRIQNSGSGFYITWNKVANASSYVVYFKRPQTSSWSTRTTSNNYYQLNNLWEGDLYYIQVRSVNSEGDNGGISKATSFTHVRSTTLYSTVYNSNGTVTIKWYSAGGANGYAIAKKRSTDKSYTYYYTSSTSFTDKNVVGGALYYYQIRPYYSNGKSAAYAQWSNSKTITTLFKPTITNMNINASRLNINWNAIKGATAYKVAFKRTTDSAWNYRTTTARYFNVVNPTKGATYVAQVCPLNGSLAGPWSDPKSATLAGTANLKKPIVYEFDDYGDRLQAEWYTVSGASYYKIAYKTSTESGWHYATEKYEEFDLYSFQKNKKYYVQVAAVNSAGQQGPWSDPVSCWS